MKKPSKSELAAILAAISFSTASSAHAAGPAASTEQSANSSLLGVKEHRSPTHLRADNEFGVGLSDKGKGKESSCKGKEGSCKGKEGSCKGKEGSCKGKEGSCKGKEGSCKGKEGSCKGKDGSCKGKDGSDKVTKDPSTNKKK